jgi:hypothetical protein
MRNKKDSVTKVASDENPYHPNPLPGFHEVSIQVFIDDVNMMIYCDVLTALNEIKHKAWEMGWRFKFRPIGFAESLYSVPGVKIDREGQERVCAAGPAEKAA